MKITAITVCVGVADFFKYALEYNIGVFDSWVVITDNNDKLTEELCLKYPKVILVKTNVFYENGAKFKKFAGINEGLKFVDEDAWCVFIDADIILSPFARRSLEKLDLNKEKIYGIDRLNCVGFEKWIEYQKKEGVLHDNWLLHSAGLEWGARIIHIYGE